MWRPGLDSLIPLYLVCDMPRSSAILRWHQVLIQWKAAAVIPHATFSGRRNEGQKSSADSAVDRTYFLVGLLAEKHRAATWLGGKRDPGEEATPWRTAAREFREESGLGSSPEGGEVDDPVIHPKLSTPVYIRQAKMYAYLTPGQSVQELPKDFAIRRDQHAGQLGHDSKEVDRCRAERLTLRSQIDAAEDQETRQELQEKFDAVLAHELSVLPRMQATKVKTEMKSLHWVDGVSALTPYACWHLSSPQSEGFFFVFLAPL